MLLNLFVSVSSTWRKSAVHSRPEGMGMERSILLDHDDIFTAILPIHFSMNLVAKRSRFVVMDGLGKLSQQSEDLQFLSV